MLTGPTPYEIMPESKPLAAQAVSRLHQATLNRHDMSRSNSLPAPEEPISALNQAGDFVVLLLGTGLTGLACWLRTKRRQWLGLFAISQAILAGLFWIFRQPMRCPPPQQGVALAVSDGTVTSIQQVNEPRILQDPAYRIDIAVSLLSPQVQRAPLSGLVCYRRYEPPGQSPSGEQRHSQWLGIEQAEGEPPRAKRKDLEAGAEPAAGYVLVRLVASSLWRLSPLCYVRRILCWPELGDTLQAGQQIGHLPLGGRLEVYLPPASRILARPGQRVRAGETILATLPSPTTSEQDTGAGSRVHTSTP